MVCRDLVRDVLMDLPPLGLYLTVFIIFVGFVVIVVGSIFNGDDNENDHDDDVYGAIVDDHLQ
jgi:hypothetical protein